ncbi:uncharacterized protein LOC110812168 [Carica papaya]|uniref:uncharacterized protein LOC110812168 n=1 Tax=Carica papaya TaxID=3649 RepID=UPI000B8D0581|nr:uncharacterized protein LOC110812168 [Carica papaya]
MLSPFLVRSPQLSPGNQADSSPAMADLAIRRKLIAATTIHVMALDGIVNVNSLFTLALFLGLTWFPTTDPSATFVDISGSCAAGSALIENLVSSHVYSFSSFLFSSLVASALKQAIKIRSDQRAGVACGESVSRVRVNLMALRVGSLVSGFGSVFGCGFLTLALADLVQIKLGTLGCGSRYTFAALGPLVVLVPSALVIYLSLVLYAFTR